MASILKPANFGADPARVKWTIVRGDTSSIRVDFLDDDELTPFNTDNWSYVASAYDARNNSVDELSVESGDGYVIISIDPDTSANWGSGYSSTVAELSFDLEVSMDEIIWTPLIGTISVMADISGSL
jgi:hypothetical protein